MVKLIHRELTGKIIGAYFQVYNGLSHTYPEFLFENAMVKLLRSQGIECRQQPEYVIRYKERRVGGQRLDIFVAGEVVVELKVTPRLKKVHKAQTYSYMKVTDCRVGMLFNFGGSEPEFERLYWDPAKAPEKPPQRPAGELAENLLYPALTSEILGATIDVHRTLGPGFVHRIYSNACYHELKERGVPAEVRRKFQVYFQGETIGQLKFNHFIVDGKIMLFPVAVREIDSININNLKDWMRENEIRLGMLVNFLDTRIRPVFIVDSKYTHTNGT